ncbi:hypothetical protein EAF04_007337 [Stromatinia cepivora]|nr:hypothetical protein EAF04_007337 [Stromatinia cepivora]
MANELLWRTPKRRFRFSLAQSKKADSIFALFQELFGIILKYIEEGTRWDSFSGSDVIASNVKTKVASLHCWCRDILITSQTRAFFGDYSLKLEPRMTQLFDEWDINSWMITYQFPDFMAKAATAPRDKLIGALAHYLDAPRERRGGGVPFVNELEDEERNAGLCSENCATILMIILWGLMYSVMQREQQRTNEHLLDDGPYISSTGPPCQTLRRDCTCHGEDRAPRKHKSRYHGEFDKERFGRSLPASKFCYYRSTSGNIHWLGSPQSSKACQRWWKRPSGGR